MVSRPCVRSSTVITDGIDAGDPPFFLSTQRQYFPNIIVSSGSDEAPFGGERKDDSENDDLRGVIDDLTVENKRLKMLLKDTRPRSSSSSASALQAQDRLFDLRVHGLSVSKKRELELLLMNFATDVRSASNTASTSSAMYGSVPVQSNSEKSSGVSRQPRGKLAGVLPTDSGYESLSTSGMTSGNTKAGGSVDPYASNKVRGKNIRNYLHDIPDSLLQTQALNMSKGAKMALVVRRLENLFTGRGAVPGEHSQPLQQQEVSRSAAHTDDPTHRRGPEGSREAAMLPQDTKVNLDAFDLSNSSPLLGKPRLAENQSCGPSRVGSPTGQRPTRPLDLDVHRAQIADDNIQYLRHLGMSSPHIVAPSEHNLAESRWVYLNLLVSMAQLHTINVTPSFVRQAIRKVSTRFELSSDGRRVRWCGGSEGTVFTNEEEQAIHGHVNHSNPADYDEDSGGTSSKRSKTNSSSNALTSEELSSRGNLSALQTNDGSRQRISTVATSNLLTEQTTKSRRTGTTFDYKPLVYKGRRYSPAVSYLQSSTSSRSNSNDSSDLARDLSKTNLNRKASDDGIITFYQDPYFCTDLSADNVPVNWVPQRVGVAWNTIGIQRDFVDESPLRYHDACYFTPQFSPEPYRPAEVEHVLSCNMTPIDHSGQYETVPMELDASGIGGIVPADNFALDVKVVRKSTSLKRAGSFSHVPVTRSRKRSRYEYMVDQCDLLELQPSKLPPPSHVFFNSSSSSGEHDSLDMSDSDETSSEGADGNGLPPAFLNQWSTESEADDDDSLVDMLEMARAADPDRFAAQEREYLINQNIERKVEGSLAATVGGSRFGSSRGGNDVRDEMDFDNADSSDDE